MNSILNDNGTDQLLFQREGEAVIGKVPTAATNLDFFAAAQRLKGVITRTPLMLNQNLSRQYQCNVFLKREDLQVVRSYKLRGAFNMMSSMLPEELDRGVVCASAGNHAQGFAYSCKKLRVKGVVFMPVITPNQKITQTRMFGGEWIEVKLVGDTFDDCARAARQYTQENGRCFIPPSTTSGSSRARERWPLKYWKMKRRLISCLCP